MNPRIIIVDTYYPEVIRRFECDHPEWSDLDYDSHLQAVLDELFGTADFYSRNLRALGWEAIDVIANYPRLQGTGDIEGLVLRQIDRFSQFPHFIHILKHNSGFLN